jgi:predicted O-methyltransferase YrrM
MAYHGYLPMMKNFIHRLPHPPFVIEIGVDRGVSLFPLAAFMARAKEQFVMVGVDILVQEQVTIMSRNLDLSPNQQLFLIQGNSLDVLPKLVAQGMKFDLVLLDGDHNFHTVQQELLHLEDLCHPHSLVIIDDYEGRWSDKDLWYAERPDYKDVKDATAKIETEKHGVKPAVDEFLAAYPEWKTARPLAGEPILLTRVNI